MSDDPNERSELLRLLAVLALAGVMVVSFFGDWKMVTTGGSIDYRNRITGARVMAEGLDPFHYKWRRGAAEELCDPYNNLAVTVSQTTVTPTYLFLMLPLAALSYGDAQVLWLVIEWACLLGTGVVWWRLLTPGWKRWAWAAVVAGFSHTLAWKHHVDRGQVYALLVFLLSLWVALTRSQRQNWAGVVAGLLLCVRPPLLLLLAPFIGLRDRAQWRAALISTMIFALLPMALRGGIWQDYLSGMKDWSALHRQGERPRPPAETYPATIECIELDTLARYHVRQYADSSIIRILKGQGILNFPDWPLGLALAAGVGVWWWSRRQADEMKVLAGILAWAFLMDWFLPAYRNPYNDLLVLSVFACALLAGRKSLWIALLGIPAGWVLYQIMPTARWQIHVPTVIMLVAGICLLLPKLSRGKAARA